MCVRFKSFSASGGVIIWAGSVPLLELSCTERKKVNHDDEGHFPHSLSSLAHRQSKQTSRRNKINPNPFSNTHFLGQNT